MLSFNEQYSHAQKLVGDNGVNTTTFLKLNINVGNQIAEAKLGSYFTEDTATDLTEVGVDSYPLPDRIVRLKEVYVIVGGVRYTPTRRYNELDWQRLKQQGSTTQGDIPTDVFVRRDTIEFYPTPATAGNVITHRFESSFKFLTQDDYSTGTITTLANGGITITGNSTVWDATFVGRQFKINTYPIWYPISGYTSSTVLTLLKPYQGTAISAGTAAYTIGEFSRLPPPMHILPVYYAAGMYFATKKDKTWFDYYIGSEDGKTRPRGLFWQGIADGKATFGKRDSSSYIPSQKHLRSGYPRDPIYPIDLT